jgi:hypothetical protein
MIRPTGHRCPEGHEAGGLSALTADQVTDDLRRMAVRSDRADWQMRSIVDAFRLLLVDLALVPAE